MQKLPFHEIDRFPSSKGCAGIGVCSSCDKLLSEQVGKAVESGFLKPGYVMGLPFHYLLVWDDATFTTLPKVNSTLN